MAVRRTGNSSRLAAGFLLLLAIKKAPVRRCTLKGGGRHYLLDSGMIGAALVGGVDSFCCSCGEACWPGRFAVAP